MTTLTEPGAKIEDIDEYSQREISIFLNVIRGSAGKEEEVYARAMVARHSEDRELPDSLEIIKNDLKGAMVWAAKKRREVFNTLCSTEGEVAIEELCRIYLDSVGSPVSQQFDLRNRVFEWTDRKDFYFPDYWNTDEYSHSHMGTPTFITSLTLSLPHLSPENTEMLIELEEEFIIESCIQEHITPLPVPDYLSKSSGHALIDALDEAYRKYTETVKPLGNLSPNIGKELVPLVQEEIKARFTF